MKMHVFSVFDSTTEEYSPPFCSKNTKTAIRSFIQMTHNHVFREDLKLFLIGTFNPEEGKILGEQKQEIKPDEYGHTFKKFLDRIPIQEMEDDK